MCNFIIGGVCFEICLVWRNLLKFVLKFIMWYKIYNGDVLGE